MCTHNSTFISVGIGSCSVHHVHDMHFVMLATDTIWPDTHQLWQMPVFKHMYVDTFFLVLIIIITSGLSFSTVDNCVPPVPEVYNGMDVQECSFHGHKEAASSAGLEAVSKECSSSWYVHVQLCLCVTPLIYLFSASYIQCT